MSIGDKVEIIGKEFKGHYHIVGFYDHFVVISKAAIWDGVIIYGFKLRKIS